MWYLIVLTPDLCTLTYLLYLSKMSYQCLSHGLSREYCSIVCYTHMFNGLATFSFSGCFKLPCDDNTKICNGVCFLSFNPDKPYVLVVGHRQTVQHQIKSGVWSGSLLFAYYGFFWNLNKNEKYFPQQP